jgi:DNA-binding NarL/FixJ family response regulator
MAVRVLLVDDDPRLRWVLARLLGDVPDVRVVGEAADGADAVRAAMLTDPDVIVLDHAMPQSTGLEVLTRLHEAAPQAQVIFFSGVLSADQHRQATANGATVIGKDRPTRDLIAAVRAAGQRCTATT